MQLSPSGFARRLATSGAFGQCRSERGEHGRQTARGTPRADHRRRHRDRRSCRRAASRRGGEGVAARPAAGAAQEVAGEVGGAAIQCDVTDRDSIARAFDEARAANGPIDMLIVNAGIADSAPFHRTTRESWDRIIATNLTAAFDRRAGGACPTCSRPRSARGLRRFRRGPRAACPMPRLMPPRSMALLGLMRSLAAEYRQDEDDRERGLPRLC